MMCKKTRARINRFALAMVVAASAPTLTCSTPGYASDRTSVKQGVPVEEEKIGNRTYQVCRIQIKAPAEHVWKLLTDYENANAIFPCLKKSRVLTDNGNRKIVEQQIKPSGVPGTFTYVVEVTEIPGRLQKWHRLRGDFTEVEGFFKLEPGEDHTTLVTYASYCSGGLFMPQGLIKRQARIDLPQVVAALKHTSETTRQIASREQSKNY